MRREYLAILAQNTHLLSSIFFVMLGIFVFGGINILHVENFKTIKEKIMSAIIFLWVIVAMILASIIGFNSDNIREMYFVPLGWLTLSVTGIFITSYWKIKKPYSILYFVFVITVNIYLIVKNNTSIRLLLFFVMVLLLFILWKILNKKSFYVNLFSYLIFAFSNLMIVLFLVFGNITVIDIAYLESTLTTFSYIDFVFLGMIICAFSTVLGLLILLLPIKYELFEIEDVKERINHISETLLYDTIKPLYLVLVRLFLCVILYVNYRFSLVNDMTIIVIGLGVVLPIAEFLLGNRTLQVNQI